MSGQTLFSAIILAAFGAILLIALARLPTQPRDVCRGVRTCRFYNADYSCSVWKMDRSTCDVGGAP